jgi:glycyl-tRNA synthetase beta chain
VVAFAQERVRFVLEHRGLPSEVVRAATAAAGDVVPLRARRVAEALQALRTSADFQALAALFKRVKNIAKELTGRAALDREALTEPAEQALLAALDGCRPEVEAAEGRADYRRALTVIAGLRPAVDRFFTDVFVMADDQRLRTARLTLMADLRDLILSLADISEIVSQTE